MKKAYFITGTDTGVGKTAVAVSLASCFKRLGLRVGVMKPVETGCQLRDGGLVGSDTALLIEAASSTAPLELINPYSFAPPISPELAARKIGVEIDFALIRKGYEEIDESSDVMIVEGAGGLLAPLGVDLTMADLVAFLDIPLIIVAPSRIGVINQCMLTARAARARGLSIMGIILNHPALPDSADHSLDSNREEVARHTGVEVLCELPYTKNKGPYNVRALAKRLLCEVS